MQRSDKSSFLIPALLVLIVMLAAACSTKKNTWSSRTYQAVNTRFNVYFNGYLSYQDGLKNILKSNKDDYSSIIPMYPVSRHSNATAAKGDMDRTIEKCRKAIKLHSIKVKPDKKAEKMSDPDYRYFYNQEEFNSALIEAWLLLGQAEFHKGDFLGAIGTFSYIARHYSSDKNIVAVCQLWIVRAYAEMGWIYEAEQQLSKINPDNLKRSNEALFASVNADLLLKKQQYKEAIPFLKLALEKEKDKDKDMQRRFSFLLAQLYQRNNDRQAAFAEYTNVLKLNPPYEMDFNARINRAQLNTESVVKVRKELRTMLKNKNNKEYRDQIFYALGNTYLINKDTLKAIENYKLSVDTSTRKGIEKAVSLITLADIYYNRRKYIDAQPCYEEASKIVTKEYDDFARVSRRAETLSELVTQQQVVLLQDSLQALSKLSDKEKLEVVTKLIEKIKREEKLAAERELKQNEQRARQGMEDVPEMEMPIGFTAAGGWYFYNPAIIRTGAMEFNRKWGTRKLEDNWRRISKSASVFSEQSTRVEAVDSTSLVADSANVQKANVADDKKPEFYLRQIPVTQQQLDKSNADIASALLAMGEIYKEKVEDYPMAEATFLEFVKRFGADKRVPDALFSIYMIHVRSGNTVEAERYRLKLITEYPGTKYQIILSQPDYSSRMERMAQEQDSIYTETYRAYSRSDYKTVFENVAHVQKNYPLAALMPKFMFLNALSVGKSDSQDKFKSALTDLISNFPASDVSAMAKDILALMKQGQAAKNGTTGGTLLSRRDEKAPVETIQLKDMTFTVNKQSRHRVMFVSKASTEAMNKLQYEVAAFNFSRFMIKDFDLIIHRLDTSRSVLSVSNFESYDEAVWYLNSISADKGIKQLLENEKVQHVIISDENFGLLRTKYSLENYLAFLSSPAAQKEKSEPVAQLQTVTKTPTLKNEKLAQVKIPPAVSKQDTVKTTRQSDKVSEKVQEKKGIAKTENALDKKAVPEQVKATKSEEKAQVESSKSTSNSAAVSKQDIGAKEVVVTKQEEVPLFKGLFGYKANEPHYIALYILSGNVDFDKLKTAFDAYNKLNYPVMNLKVSLEKVDKVQVVIVGSMPDASVAKSYLLRMVKERQLFDGLKGANYRNLIGSQKNLGIAVEQNTLQTYLEFMKEYYLK